MSKNLYRKVLAVGSTLALSAALLVSVPAQAAVVNSALGTTTYNGTGLKMVEGTAFSASYAKSSSYNFYNAATSAFSSVDHDSNWTGILANTNSQITDVIATGGVVTLTTSGPVAAGVSTNDSVSLTIDVNQFDCSGDTALEGTNLAAFTYTGVVATTNGTNTVTIAADTASKTIAVGDIDCAGNIASVSLIRTKKPTDASALDYTSGDDWVATSRVKWLSSSASVTATTGGSGSTSTLTASVASDITTSVEVTLTPYITTNSGSAVNPNTSDAGAYNTAILEGSPLVVTFIPYVESEWVSTLTSAQTTRTNANLSGTLTPATAIATGLNLAQIGRQLSFYLFKDGIFDSTDALSTSYTTDAQYATLTYDLGNFGNGTYSVRAFVSGTTYTWLGAMSANTSIQFEFNNPRVTGITLDEQAGANITRSGYVRKGTTSLDLTATIRSGSAAVKRAGVTVRFFVDVTAAGATSELAFNGTKVPLAGGAVELKTTTDSNGVAKLAVTNSVGATGDKFEVVAAVVPAADFDTRVTATRTYEWIPAVATYLSEGTWVGLGTPVLNSVKGKSYTVNYVVTDNFGQLYSGDDARVEISGGVTQNIAVVNGRASLTVTEAKVAGEVYDLNADLTLRVANTVNWGASINSWDRDVYVVSNNSAARVDANSSDSNIEVNYDEFKNHDYNQVPCDNTLYDGIYYADGCQSGSYSRTGYDLTEIYGYVTNSDGVLLPGAKVEVRGNGLFTDEYVYSQNSITTYADSSGKYRVLFASHKSGVQTISVTAGAGSASTSVTVDAPQPTSADTIRITAPKSVKAGRTVTADVDVIDIWGNVVLAPTMGSWDWAGFQATSNRGLVSTSKPTNGAEATYQVKVLLQPLDRGPVIIRALWTGDWGMTPGILAGAGLLSDYTLTAEKAVWAGPAVNATAGAKKGRVVVEAYRAVGQTVNVFVGSTKVASFVPNKANDKFVVKGLKKGNRKVTVKVTPGYDFKGVIAVK